MLLRIQCGVAFLQSNPSCSSSPDLSPSCSASSLAFSPSSSNWILVCRSRCRRRSIICCDSRGNDRQDSVDNDVAEHFLQAKVLLPETTRHYSLWKQGFVEDTKWHSPGKIHSYFKKESQLDVTSIGHGFLRRFESPTIFLKIACDGDLILPIIVGELAVTKIIDSLSVEQQKECLDLFQFIKDLMVTVGYEVKMAQITDRVINTYYARILLGKVGEKADISIDTRPSDAVCMAERFKAPIYVSKEIVLKDAIKVVYGTWRTSGAKTVYDVFLDSAVEGPDPVTEELNLVRRMKSAVLEERYQDAAIWRNKLMELRKLGGPL